MYQALYRKYRPSTFSDVCGQEHITSVLKAQLQKGRVSHAYVFYGSRGTGKTTCAKIFAKAVNCESPVDGEPCNNCPSCLAINEERVMDVVEMDAASNNGVDHIRRICDEVQFLPSDVKKRVYIIDEVHMLSTQAFNALLKTIEEPPEHVLFILATTEIDDIPATVLSRCQRFDFKRLTPSVISARLMQIAEKENISLDSEAAKVIARLSDGAMRDALSLLEACQSHKGELTPDRVHSILGLGNRSTVLGLCRAIASQDVSSCLSLLDDIYSQLSGIKELVGDLIALYRDILVIKTVTEYEHFVESYESELNQIRAIADSMTMETVLYQSKLLEEFYHSYDKIATGKKASAEILLIRLCQENLSLNTEALLSRISKLERALSGGVIQTTSIPVIEERKKEVKRIDVPEKKQEDGVLTESLRLKNKLQDLSYLKPFLEHVEFYKEGSSLVLKTGAFVKRMFEAKDVQDAVLNAAKELDLSVNDIVLREKNVAVTDNSSQFEGL